MILEKGKRVFSSVKEAEKYIEETYVGKLVHFWYWHRFKYNMKEKVEKVDRATIDITFNPPHVILFFIDGTKNEFHKDDFFNDVKLLN